VIRSWFVNLICTLFFLQCAAFQKTVKITPAAFEYQSIAENYFARGDEKPFPLTVQKGNNLYNSTTLDGRYLFILRQTIPEIMISGLGICARRLLFP
jgi:hypothetical protein